MPSRQLAKTPTAGFSSITGNASLEPTRIKVGGVQIDWVDLSRGDPSDRVLDIWKNLHFAPSCSVHVQRTMEAGIRERIASGRALVAQHGNSAVREIAASALHFWAEFLHAHDIVSHRFLIGPVPFVGRKKTILGQSYLDARMFAYAFDAKAHRDRRELDATMAHEVAHCTAASSAQISRGGTSPLVFGWSEFPVLEEAAASFAEAHRLCAQQGREFNLQKRFTYFFDLQENERVWWNKIQKAFSKDAFKSQKMLRCPWREVSEKVFIDVRDLDVCIELPIWEYGVQLNDRHYRNGYASIVGALADMAFELYLPSGKSRSIAGDHRVQHAFFTEVLKGQQVHDKKRLIDRIDRHFSHSGFDLLHTLDPYMNARRATVLLSLFVNARHLETERRECVRHALAQLAKIPPRRNEEESAGVIVS